MPVNPSAEGVNCKVDETVETVEALPQEALCWSKYSTMYSEIEDPFSLPFDQVRSYRDPLAFVAERFVTGPGLEAITQVAVGELEKNA